MDDGPELTPVDHNPWEGQPDPWEAAAMRTRQGVKPIGGRQEGKATQFLETLGTDIGTVGYGLAHGVATLPQRAIEAQQRYWQTGEQDVGPAAETALMMMGAGTQFAPRGGILGTAGSRMVQPATEAAPPFYSAVQDAVNAAKTEKAPAGQWLGTLKNTPGVKPEELDWLGVEGWLKGRQGHVTKQELADYVRSNQMELKEITKGGSTRAVEEAQQTQHEAQNDYFNGVPGAGERLDQANADLHRVAQEYERGVTKFGSYQLPGGENYREMLLTLPSKPPISFEEFVKRNEYINPEPSNPEWIARARADYENTVAGGGARPEDYRSSHWDEPNVLAHVRFNDRIIDGKKTLFLEEIQSDWHQAGKKQGYGAPTWPEDARIIKGDPTTWFIVDRDGNRLTGGYGSERIAERALREPRPFSRVIPDAPFKTTWPELALKRMLRYAAENGYEKIAWTPGEVQAARYDLSKQLSKVEWNSRDHTLIGYDHSGTPVIHENGVTPDKIENYVGKEVSEKLQKDAEAGSSYWGEASGLDLKVGGEGMAGFYDKMLPTMANKLGKKYGAKVERRPLNTADRELIDPDLEGLEAETPEQAAMLASATKETPTTKMVHTFNITPALRKTAMEKGFPKFSTGGAVLSNFQFTPVEHDPFAPH